ncbi:hypothetical protein EPUL_000821, partial [Erysiphe pulchra]
MAQHELKPQLMDERTDNISESENTETQVTSEIEPETNKESSEIPVRASSDVKKENTDETLKRSISIKRTSNSTIASGAKGTTSSVNRNVAPSKPSSKSASVSSIRRSTAQSTAPSSRHTSSVYSSGGSGDEKRKSLVSATRRTSLTPIAQHQPVKVESLAEKRGISGVNARKPTTSANTVSLKPIARSNSTASKSATIVKRSSSVNTKSSTSGTLPDSKKRLSTAPGSVIATKPQARNSSISTEVDRLKVKLELSSTKINDQEKEIKATRENVDKLSKQLDDEIHKSALTEENLKKEHGEKIEKLGNDHETKVQILKSELEKSQSTVVDVQQNLAKSVEEALQKEALKNVNAIQELKDGFESTLSLLKTQLTETQANCASLTSKLREKETEIQSLNSQIIKAVEQQKTLEQEHEKSISNLRHPQEDNQMKSIQNIETAALTEKFELKINELQTFLDKTKVSLTEAEERHRKILETTLSESESKILALQSEISLLKSEYETTSASLLASVQSRNDLAKKYESLETNLKNTQQEYDSLSEKFKKLENQNSTESQELSVARDELTQVKAQFTKQKQMMQAFNVDGKNRDESYKRMEIELEAATKKLNESKNETANFREKLEEFEKTSLSYKGIIANLQEELAIKEKAIIENDENYKNILSNKSLELNEAEKNYKNQLSLLENKILDARNEACQELKAAHLKELQDLEASHKEALSNLQHDHTNLKSESSSIIKELQTTIVDLKKHIEELDNKIIETQDELATNQKYLAQENMEKAQALAELDAYQNRKTDTTEKKSFNSNQQEQTTKGETGNDQITKTAFEQLQEELVVQQKESREKYFELKDKMTQLVEEANQKVADIEFRLKETEALLKLKDAEISEISETKIASSRAGLITNELAPVEMNISGENEDDIDPQLLAGYEERVALESNNNNNLPDEEESRAVPRRLPAWLSARRLNRAVPAGYISQCNRNMPAHDLGERTSICPSCKALHWAQEKVQNSTINSPKFQTCCKEGQVVLPPMPETPEGLRRLWTSEERDAKEFRNNSRQYNRAFAFTSFNYTPDRRLQDLGLRGGFKAFRFMARFFTKLNNPFIEYYHTALESLNRSNSEQAEGRVNQPLTVRLNPQYRLILEEGADRRRYNLPTAAEFALMIPDEVDSDSKE